MLTKKYRIISMIFTNLISMISKNDIDQIQPYLADAANYKGKCSTVYFPESTEDIVSLLKNANNKNMNVTIAGNGTGLTGSRVPDGGIVIATDKLNNIIKIDKDCATVQPGVLLDDFLKIISKKNFFYPPDPTENNCFIGGTVATNASGAKTFKYGSTRDYVIGLKIVLPTGELLTLKRGEVFAHNYNLNFTTDEGRKISIQLPEISMPSTKHAAGYFIKPDMDLIDLFIGSEGTLGVITEIDLRLLKKPGNILSSVIFFYSEQDAFNFLFEARDKSKANRFSSDDALINARALEFFDYFSLQFMREDFQQIPETAKAALWFEQEIISDENILLNTWLELIERHHGDIEKSWIATNENDRENFKDFRHTVAWKVNEFVTQRGLKKVGTDTAVPDESFRGFYNYITKIAEESGIRYVVYGHFGNSHPHMNLLPQNEEEYNKSCDIYKKICQKAVELNGTVSAEHGIGKIKRQYLLDMFGEKKIREMASVKKILDPNLILGIGNIFDPKFLQ